MPPTGSSPTVAGTRPKSTDSQPFYSVCAPTDEATARPKNTYAKISGGPTADMAQLAMIAVALIISSAEQLPPNAKQSTVAPTALPASPFVSSGSRRTPSVGYPVRRVC